MKGVDSGGVISARLIGLSAHQNEEEQILFSNADTRTVKSPHGCGGELGNCWCLWEIKPSRQSLGIISTDIVSSRRQAEGKPPRGTEVPGGAELEEERSGAWGCAPLLIETRKTESLQQRADLWGPSRAVTRTEKPPEVRRRVSAPALKVDREDHSLLRNSICLHLLTTSVHVGTCAVLMQQMGSCL